MRVINVMFEKPYIKEVLSQQTRFADLCYKKDQSGNWPNSKGDWADKRMSEHYDNLSTKATKLWNLSDVKIDDTRAILTLSPGKHDICAHFDWNINDRFILFGEISQAQGHVCVYNMRLNKMFAMVHANDFLLVPPVFN